MLIKVELQTPLGLEIKDEISQGKLVPSETIVKLLRKFLTQEASGRFTLIDGFPRSMDNLNDFIQVNRCLRFLLTFGKMPPLECAVIRVYMYCYAIIFFSKISFKFS